MSRLVPVPIHEQYGFEVVVAFDGPAGGPHVWLMWRDRLPKHLEVYDVGSATMTRTRL